jgi:hypothetical protein
MVSRKYPVFKQNRRKAIEQFHFLSKFLQVPSLNLVFNQFSQNNVLVNHGRKSNHQQFHSLMANARLLQQEIPHYHQQQVSGLQNQNLFLE